MVTWPHSCCIDCTNESTCINLNQSVETIFHFLSPIDTHSVRLTFNSLPMLHIESLPTSSALWLLACLYLNNGLGSIQKGLTFVRRMCWLSWHFGVLIYEILTMPHCKKRGNVNLKRPLSWMVVAIAAARSVLHERAAFVTSWVSSERTLLCLFSL